MSTIDTTTAAGNFPDYIKISGLPFMLQGWNTHLYRTSETRDDAPVYALRSYVLYWLIPIAEIRVYRSAGIWYMRRTDDPRPIIHKFGTSPQPDPFGYWSMGAHVQPA
jgi:hypothetical protein